MNLEVHGRTCGHGTGKERKCNQIGDQQGGNGVTERRRHGPGYTKQQRAATASTQSHESNDSYVRLRVSWLSQMHSRTYEIAHNAHHRRGSGLIEST